MRLFTRALLIASIALAAGCVCAPVGPPGYYGPAVYVHPYAGGYYHGYYGHPGYYGR